MRVQLISKNNGYGLTRDVEVLRSVLEPMGHEVHFSDWRSPRNVRRHHYHVNLFLELVNSGFFPSAPRNYFVPNPEWFINGWEKHLPAFDLILAKTLDTERIFSGMGLPTRFIGFTSPDRFDEFSPWLPDECGEVLHLVGHSVAKGTASVLEAARQIPDVKFTVIGKNAPKDVPANVKVIRSATDTEIMGHQNAHPVHCQPSSYEGFGHSINEARSVGALIVTTAAEPMSELITGDFGFGASYCSVSDERLAQHKNVCVDSLVEMIQAAVDCVGTEVARPITYRARAAYLKGREEFIGNITELMAA